MEAGINLLSKAGCRYTKEHVCKISGQYIHFHRSYDSFCKARTFVLIYRPHPVEPTEQNPVTGEVRIYNSHVHIKWSIKGTVPV